MEATQAIRTEKINQTFYTFCGGARVIGELEYIPAEHGQIMVIQRSWLVYDKLVSPDQPTTTGKYRKFIDPNEAIARVNEICGGHYTADDLTYAMEEHIKFLQQDANKDKVQERLGRFRSELGQLLDKYGIDLQHSWDDIDYDWCEYTLTMNGQEVGHGTLRDLIGDLVD